MLTTTEQHRFFLRFFHPEKGLGMLPGYTAPLWEGFLAPALGMTPDALATLRTALAAEVDGAARRLVDDAECNRLLRALPLRTGQTVVGFGDSLTDDAISWFEILQRALTLVDPDRSLRWVNAGISGHTSSDLLARLEGVREEAPDWVFCLIGSNDARFHGPAPLKSMISPGETEANLLALRSQAGRILHARWVWMTPPPVESEVIARHFWMGAQGMVWRNAEVGAAAEAMRRVAAAFPGDALVDLNAHFGSPPAPGLLDEGLHPTAAGYERFVRLLLPVLAQTVS
jgi:lysophospholipase L1-like esterase